MLFNSAVISSFLLASAVLADRSRHHRQPRSLGRVEQSTDGVIYNNNWAGAIWDKGDGTFDFITGTFTVPVLSGPNGSAASAWVGIDGDTCKNAIFRAGVDFTVDRNGTSYEAWYKWYPDYQHPFSNFTVSTGDTIRVTVVVNSTTTGTATVENLTHGQTVHQYLQSTFALCGRNAEWVVEDFGESGNLASFANFSTVTFTDAKANGATGTYTPDGATILAIKQNNRPMTAASISGSSLTIKYV